MKGALPAVIVISLGSLGVLRAQPVRNGPEFQVNTYTTEDQYLPAVAMDGAGNFVVVWTGDRQDGSETGIHGQRFDSTGSPLGVEFQVNTFTPFQQYNPDVSMDDSGNFMVVWTSLFQVDFLDVFGQRFDNFGAPVGGEFLVNTHTPTAQRAPSVEVNGSGGFIVVWQHAFEVGRPAIIGRHFDNTGPISGEFRVSSYEYAYQKRPNVAVDGSGAFVVVWMNDYPQDGSSYGAFGQRFDSTGAAIGSEFQVNTYTTSYQYRPRIAMGDTGDFVVVWGSGGQDGSYAGVFGQRFDSTGALLGGEFQVNTHTGYYQGEVDVAADSYGNFVVVWVGPDEYPQYGVFGQAFDSAGVPVGGEFQVNTYAPLSMPPPSIAMNALGDFIVVWTSSRRDGNGLGVFGQRYESPFERPCVDPEPFGQGYWYRQCLAVSGPNGMGHGPTEPTEQDFETEILPAVDSLLESKVSVPLACEEGMNAQPPSDTCEIALKHYTALLFNLASDRLQSSCMVDLLEEGCASTTVGELVEELAGMINSGDPESCHTASECAELLNGGRGMVDGASVQLTPLRSSPQPISLMPEP